jgi:hypothetical protein
MSTLCPFFLFCLGFILNGSVASGQTPDFGHGRRGRSDFLLNRLERPIKFEGFPNPQLTLLECLAYFDEKYGLKIIFDEGAFKEDGAKNLLDLAVSDKNLPKSHPVKLKTLLRLCLAQIPVRSRGIFIVRGEYVEITSAKTMKGELQERWVELKQDFRVLFRTIGEGLLNLEPLPFADMAFCLNELASFDAILQEVLGEHNNPDCFPNHNAKRRR